MHVPACMNLSLSCFPGIVCFPLHYTVTFELKVQSGFGVGLQHKRQEGVFSSLLCLMGRVCIQKRNNCRKPLFLIDFNEASEMSSSSVAG